MSGGKMICRIDQVKIKTPAIAVSIGGGTGVIGFRNGRQPNIWQIFLFCIAVELEINERIPSCVPCGNGQTPPVREIRHIPVYRVGIGQFGSTLGFRIPAVKFIGIVFVLCPGGIVRRRGDDCTGGSTGGCAGGVHGAAVAVPGDGELRYGVRIRCFIGPFGSLCAAFRGGTLRTADEAGGIHVFRCAGIRAGADVLRKGRGGEHGQHHGAEKQDTQQSFHDRFSFPWERR